MTIRIVLADDSRVFRQVLVYVLAAAPDLEVLAAVTDGPALITACTASVLAPDVVIMDVDMPGGGPALAEQVRRLSSTTNILCLSARDDVDTVLTMLAAGANAYVAKGGLDDDLTGYVRRCAAGTLFVIGSCAEGVRREICHLLGRARRAS